MKPDSKKNKKLRKQYPFLESILSMALSPQAGNRGAQINDLTIKVKRADGDLLYREAQNRGCLGNNTITDCTNESRKGQVVKRGEHCFAFSKDGEELNNLPHDDGSVPAGLPVYVEQIFWKRITGNSRTGPIFEDVKFLVWLTVEAYYKDNGDKENPYGEFVDRTLEVTIYKEPKAGFFNLYRNSRLEDHLFLSNKVFMRDAVRRERQLDTLTTRLQELADIFYESVYTQGMEEILEAVDFKGCSGEFGGVSVKATWGLGRVGVGLSNSEIDIEFNIIDETKVMYMNSVYGRLPAIRKLVMNVIQAWTDEEARKTFGPDKSVKNFAQVLNETAKS